MRIVLSNGSKELEKFINSSNIESNLKHKQWTRIFKKICKKAIC